jgi:hypothetical protein
MVNAGEDTESIERTAGHADLLRDGWKRTLEDMEQMAEEREEEGWEVLTIAAGDTAPEVPEVRDDDRFGIVYVIPGNKVDRFQEFYRETGFGDYHVYQAEVSGQRFAVTELMDPHTDRVMFVAGQYAVGDAEPVARIAAEEGKVVSIIQQLDGTLLGTFKHDEVTAFFPEAERFAEADEPADDEESA